MHTCIHAPVWLVTHTHTHLLGKGRYGTHTGAHCDVDLASPNRIASHRIASVPNARKVQRRVAWRVKLLACAVLLLALEARRTLEEWDHALRRGGGTRVPCPVFTILSIDG